MMKYQVHDQQKELTELRLKIDTLDSKIAGLHSDKTHLEVALQEQQEFRQIYEEKSIEMKEKYTDLLLVYNDVHQRVVGFEEVQKSMQERIDN